MTTLICYSFDSRDNSTLNTIAPHLLSLSTDQQAALAIASLYEAYEPDSVCFDYDKCLSRRYDQCIELIQLLSKAGKLALCRAITEHLAVAEMVGKWDGATEPENQLQALFAVAASQGDRKCIGQYNN